MNDKTKNIIITIGFAVILIATFIANIFLNDKEISIAERRKLTQISEIKSKKIMNGNAMKKFESYAVDQFIGRDFFREIKTFCTFNIFNQKDYNNLFEIDDALYKTNYPLNENNIKKSADRINKIYDKYLKDMNVYYAIIPEKNCYLNDNYLKIEYQEIEQKMKEELYSNMKYINIYETLTLDDYYKTDLHWKQENLINVANVINENMKLNKININNYELKNMGKFYGTYYGQLSVSVLPDTLYILTNETLENCTTYNYEKNETSKVYKDTASPDRYDIFLSGATPIISIENPNAKDKKELLMFRDSFGSSLAPLLIENYSKITLIDIRYVSSQILDKYIEFVNQDVLFIYSTLILNENVLK